MKRGNKLNSLILVFLYILIFMGIGFILYKVFLASHDEPTNTNIPESIPEGLPEEVEEKIPVNNIDILEEEIILLPDSKYFIYYEVSPGDANDKTVKWSSSNEKVVTVDKDGIAYSHSLGEAIVTVKTTNGKKDSCKVIVKKETTENEVTSIKLSKESLTLYEGESSYLKYELLPSGTTSNITWSSSNPDIISVSDVGEIRALKEGKAIIYVKTSNDKTDSCKVEVIKRQEKVIEVTNININETSLTLKEGENFKLNATISPSNATNKTIQWVSDNTDVARVSNAGVVSGVSIGKAKIYAMSESGVYIICEVQVIKAKKEIEVTDLSFDTSEVTLKKGDKKTLKVVVSPVDATSYTITWSSSNSSVASVSLTGVVNALKAGETIITASSNNGQKATIKIKVTADPTLITATKLFSYLPTTNLEMAQISVFSGGKIQSNYAYNTNNTTQFKVSTATKSVLGIVAAKMDSDGIINLDTRIDNYWHSLNSRNFSTCTEEWRSMMGSESTIRSYTASSKDLVENKGSLRTFLTHSSTVKNMNMVHMDPTDTTSEYFGGGLSKTYARAAFMLAHTSHQLFEKGGVPGTTTSYSITNDKTTRDHAVAGFTMQIAMKESINEYMTREILTPLGAISSPYFRKGNSIYFATSYNTSAEDLAKIISAIANDGVYNGNRIFTTKAINNIEKVETKLNNQTIAFDYVDGKFTKYGSISSMSNPSAYGLTDVVSYYNSYISYDPNTSIGFVLTAKYNTKIDKTTVYNNFRKVESNFYSQSK